MSMILRPYQKDAVRMVYNHLYTKQNNPACVMSTGSGKSVVIAEIIKDTVTRWGGRVLVLTHVRELVQQNSEKLKLLSPDIRMGIYSAGLSKRDTAEPVIFASIQSVYKKVDILGKFELIIIDEAHLLSEDSDSMYQRLIREAKDINPTLRVVGFTATPYRMKTGWLCREDAILNEVCYNTDLRQLIDEGYLSPLVSKTGLARVDTSGLHVRAGEFIQEEVEDLMDRDELISMTCDEIVDSMRDRKACLIFATSIAHAEHIAGYLERKYGIFAKCIFGHTPKNERSETISDFKNGKVRYLINVNVLTTGFDAPHVDCIALVRPTHSTGLLQQMVGRGLRTSEGKKDCLILDYGENILRHGPIDEVNIVKKNRERKKGKEMARECPNCRSLWALAIKECRECGHIFYEEKKNPSHKAHASTAEVLSVTESKDTHRVHQVNYYVHKKFGTPEDGPRSMRVDYKVGEGVFKREYICFEHEGFARRMAELWWKFRSDTEVPTSTEDAVFMAENGILKEPGYITVTKKRHERWPKISEYDFESEPLKPNRETDDFFDYEPAAARFFHNDPDEMPF